MHRLLLLAVLFAGTAVADDPILKAPIYSHQGGALLQRSGTLHYKKEEGFEILYCVTSEEKQDAVQCIVRTPGDMLMMVAATVAQLKST